MKKIFYIEKYIKIFQVYEKLSKIVKVSTKSKKINEIQNYFSKKQKKNDLLESKIYQKIKCFNNNFLFFFSNSRYFLFHSRLSFVVYFQRNFINEIIVVI